MFACNKKMPCLILVLFCLFILHYCKNGTIVPGLVAEGYLTSYNGCKAAGTSGISTEALSESNAGQECLEYEYDGSTLLLKHVNAAFNCCLDGMEAEVDIDGERITITETEKLANGLGCFCICLYDLSYLITNLEQGVYTVVISSFLNLIEIDLSIPTSGTYCEERNGYPWN